MDTSAFTVKDKLLPERARFWSNWIQLPKNQSKEKDEL